MENKNGLRWVPDNAELAAELAELRPEVHELTYELNKLYVKHYEALIRICELEINLDEALKVKDLISGLEKKVEDLRIQLVESKYI